MSGKIDKLRSSMTFNMIGAIVFLIALFGVIVSVLGFVSFTNAFKREYSTSTYHMAKTATTLINGDHIYEYLEGLDKDEYLRTQSYLDAYCQAMSVSLIYVIDVDKSDYGRFVSIFNSVDNAVDNTLYEPWELGHERETTNEEYKDKYEAVYNKEKPYETVYRMKTTDGQNPHITTIVPVTDSLGEVVAVLCLQRPARELYGARIPYLLNIIVSGVILAIVVSVIASLYIRRQFILPIRKVSKEAMRFSKDNTKGEGLDNVSRIDELSELASSIDIMESEMISYIENLTSVTAEKERISTELSLASAIQMNSVPNDFPAFPQRNDFDIYATMTPAKEVGGDFYNFFLIDDDHLAVVIGDVSGKGVPAALFMMVTNILVSFRTRAGGTPSEILSFVNDDLCEHNTVDMFVTIWLGILELSSGKLVYSNAGHEDPAVYRKKDNAFELVKTKHGFIAGGMPNMKFSDFEMTLEKGDRLFIYTDGVPEATNKDNKMFGLDRMMKVLNKNAKASLEDLLKNVHKEADGFVGEAPQFDDLTRLCLERK